MKKSNYTSNYQDLFLDIDKKKDLLHSTSHPVFYKLNNSAMNYSYFSPSIEELTGYTSKELSDLGFGKAIKDEVIAEIDFDKDLSDKDNHYFSRYWIETKNGNWKLIENWAFPDNELKPNEIKNVTGFIRDVTDINDYLLSLVREKEKLNCVIEFAHVMIIILDTEGNVNIINEMACNILGYSKEELIGKNWFDILIPEENKNVLRNYFSKLNAGFDDEIEYNENPVITKSGEERIIGWYNKAFRDNDNKILFWICSGEDVTKRKEEEKIQQVISNILQTSNRETNLNEFFNYMHSEISQLMPAKNFYIALYDKPTETISFPYWLDESDAYIPPKKFGKGLTEYVIRYGKSALITQELDNELVRKGETELVGTQSAIWLGIPLKITDFTIGALVVQDYENPNTYTEKEQKILEVIAYSISRSIERKRLEEDRTTLIKKLEKMNSSKDKLFSLISHDLRSPFNSLLGFSEILTKEYESLTNEEIKEYIKAIYDSSKNLYGMTNNLLQFSRFQLGKIGFNPKVIDLTKTVNSVFTMLKGNILKKQINVESTIPDNTFVYADEDMLNSIFQNLVSNAIKFTYKRGDLKIASEIITENGQEFVLISVEDSGIGMNDSDVKRILEGDVFTTPGTDKEYGTGLGIQLVIDFINKNGGSLQIKSKLNMGSTFIFTIPFSK